jgi:hypothetical protein
MGGVPVNKEEGMPRDDQRCATCDYWQRQGEGVSSKGLCRRKAPVPFGSGYVVAGAQGRPDLISVAVWPKTAPDDWCGDGQWGA